MRSPFRHAFPLTGVLAATLGLGCAPPPDEEAADDVETVASALSVTDVSGSYRPVNGEAVLCTGANFTGVCKLVSGQANFALATAIGLPDNSIASVKTGCHSFVSLCDNGVYGGGCENRISGSVPDLRALTPTTNVGISPNAFQRASSLKVQSRVLDCRKGPTAILPGYVFLYRQPNFQGDCIVRSRGSMSNAAGMGIGDNLVSSIVVGGNSDASNMFVELYDSTNFGGLMLTLGPNSAISDLSQTALGNVNDRLSSLRISGGPPSVMRLPTCVQ